MRTVIIRIEDNTAKIVDLQKQEKAHQEFVNEINKTLDELLQEKFFSIMMYAKSYYDDYVRITGEKDMIINDEYRKSYIEVEEDKIVFSCAKSRVIGKREGDGFKLDFVNKTDIDVLLRFWKDLKPEFQNKINKVIQEKMNKMKSEQSKLNQTLEIVQNFEV